MPEVIYTNYQSGETDYTYEDSEVVEMLVDITALNGQYAIDVA